MTAEGRGRGQILAAILFILIHEVTNAPVTEEGGSHALQLADTVADGLGCYYNFEHYDEGDRIVTNEPCLNCTCHNRMLMCYLRVCPFTKAIGQDCTVEKKPDQCCPVITCPQVPVALLTSTTSEKPLTTSALGRPDSYGCILEDNTFYADGAQVPSDPRKPCELCYCIRNHTACLMQECTLNVEGCKPVYQEGVCCPVRYQCDYDEVPATTPKPSAGLVTTPGGSSDCLHNGKTYHDGEQVEKSESAPCEHCYCMRGDIVCAVQECGAPLEGSDCVPLERSPGQCCPNYRCSNTTQDVETIFTSTETIPEEVKQDSAEAETHDADESNESESSSEESHREPEPEAAAAEPEKPTEGTTVPQEEAQPTDAAPQYPSVAEVSATGVVSQESTGTPHKAIEETKPEEPVQTVESQPEDSHSEASQHEETEAIVPSEAPKEPQVSNEIPVVAAGDQEPPALITTEAPSEAARVPGEGSCLVEGKTFAHNTIVPTENPCQEICTCFSSIVSCKPRDCPPAPSPEENCMPITTPGACCPTYMCDQKTSDAPEAEDQKIDEDEHIQVHPTTHLPPYEEPPATDAPVFHPESPISVNNEDGQSTETANESHVPHEESGNTVAEEEPATQHFTTQNPHVESHMNPNLVHGHDAPLHGGPVETLDSQVNGNRFQPPGEVTTEAPTTSDEVAHQENDNAPTIAPIENAPQTEQPSIEHQEPQTVSPVIENEEEKDSTQEGQEPSGQSGTAETAVGPTEAEEHAVHQEDGQESESAVTTSKPEGISDSFIHDTISEETISTDAPGIGEPSSASETPDHSVAQDIHDEHNEDQASDALAPESEPAIETTAAPSVSQDEVKSPESPSSPTVSEPSDDEIAIATSVLLASEQQTESSSQSSEAPPAVETAHDVEEPGTENTAPEQEKVKLPTTALPTDDEQKVAESTEVPHSEPEHQDSLPESSQQTVETAEKVEEPPIEQDTKLEEVPEVTAVTETQPAEQDESTSPPTVSEQEKVEEIVDEHKQDSGSLIPATEVPEIHRDNVEVEKQPEDIPQEQQTDETSEDKKPDETPVTTEAAHQHQETPGISHDEVATIIYEEVSVSGMPSIESHVTEGHHTEAHQNVETTTQADPEIPAQTETPVVKDSEENSIANNQDTSNKEPEQPTHSQTHVDHNEEVKSPAEGEVHKQATSEAINEIHENKEPVQPISSDNTAQLIDDINHIIQNEINNQLHPGEQQQANAPNGHEAPQVSVTSQPDSSIQEAVQETTALPSLDAHNSISTEESSGISSDETPEKNISGVNQESTEKVILTETEPAESVPAEPESVPSSESVTSVPASEEGSKEQLSESDNKDEAHQLSEGAGGSESVTTTTEVYQTPTDTVHQVTNVESAEQNKNEINEISTELSQDKISEAEENPSNGQTLLEGGSPAVEIQAQTEINPSVPHDESEKPAEVTEAPQEDPEVVTHITNAVSQIPDSANQVLEASGDDEVPVPQQPSEEPLKVDNDFSSTILPEEGLISGVDVVHQEESPAEGNAVAEDQNKQEVLHEDTSSEQSPQNELVKDHHEETPSEHVPPEKTEEEQHTAVTEQQESEKDSQPTYVDSSEPTHEEPANVPEQPYTPTGEQEVVVSQEGLPSEHQESGVEQQEHATEHQVPVTEAPAQITEEQHKLESDQHEAVTSTPVDGEKAGAVTEKEEQVTEQQSVEGAVQEPTNHHNVQEHQVPITENEIPVVEHHEHVTEHHDTVAGEQEPASEHPGEKAPQEVVTERIEEVVEHQEVVTEHQESDAKPDEEHHEISEEHSEPAVEHHEPSSEQGETNHQETSSEHSEAGHHETSSEHSEEDHHETSSEHSEADHHETSEHSEADHHEASSEHSEEDHHETSSEHSEADHHDTSEHSEADHHEASSEHSEPEGHQKPTTEHVETEQDNQESSSEHAETVEQLETSSEPVPIETEQDHHETSSENVETEEHHEITSAPISTGTEQEHHEPSSEHVEPVDHHETTSVPISIETEQEHHEPSSEHVEPEEHHEASSEHQEIVTENQEHSSEPQEHVTEHPESEPSAPSTSSSSSEASDKVQEVTTSATSMEISSTEPQTEKPVEDVPKQETPAPSSQDEKEEHKDEDASAPVAIVPESSSPANEQEEIATHKPQSVSESVQSVVHSTETVNLNEGSSPQKPEEEPSPMFPSWSPKPFEQHTTPEPHPQEENPYPSGYDPEYEDEDGASYGPGTCRYGGKVYLSAQQVPRDDPCDFCFCFRSDIICLQQSCPPPIRGCYQETIKGFCCPRYECHVSMATMLNITTTTTTTTTTLPPHFFAHAYNGAATKAGCQVKGVAYHVGERIPSTSGPCLECRCGANGQMKCDPTVCGPQETLLRQVMEEAVSRKRRR